MTQIKVINGTVWKIQDYECNLFEMPLPSAFASEMLCENICFELTTPASVWDNLDLSMTPGRFCSIKASLPWLVWGIHLACQSQVHEMQHFFMDEKRSDGGVCRLYRFEILLCSALFFSLSLYNSWKTPTATLKGHATHLHWALYC